MSHPEEVILPTTESSTVTTWNNLNQPFKNGLTKFTFYYFTFLLASYFQRGMLLKSCTCSPCVCVKFFGALRVSVYKRIMLGGSFFFFQRVRIKTSSDGDASSFNLFSNYCHSNSGKATMIVEASALDCPLSVCFEKQTGKLI